MSSNREWREWHLNREAGPKRILSLDGGGVRGLITLGMLEHIERILASRNAYPDGFRLAHYFDLIAGTSTGSIIATGLALGMKVDEVSELYHKLCPKLFDPVARGFWRPVYDYRPLEEELKTFLGNEQLQSDKLMTGLMICAKRIDTGSPWVLTNNPKSVYWNSVDQRYRPNKEYELRMVVRASTAAPLYFEPVEIVISDGKVYEREVGLFVDGGVAGLNNPGFQAFLTTTLPSYGFNWPSGRDALLVISLGTGYWRQEHTISDFKALPNWKKAVESLTAMIHDTSMHAVLALQSQSNARKPWSINTEVKTLAGELATNMESLTFQRYDAYVTADAVKRVFQMRGDTAQQVSKINALLAQLRSIGNTDLELMRKLYAMGHDAGSVKEVGKDGIEPEDFPAQFDPDFMKKAAV